MTTIRGLIYTGICLTLFACNKPVQVTNGNLKIEVNDRLETRVLHLAPGTKPLMSGFSSTEYLVCKRIEWSHRAQGP